MTGPRDNDTFEDPARLAREVYELDRRLERERPVPRAGFRAGLRASLLREAGRRKLQRGKLRLRVAAYAGAGLSLLAVVALGVAGAGPLAAG